MPTLQELIFGVAVGKVDTSQLDQADKTIRGMVKQWRGLVERSLGRHAKAERERRQIVVEERKKIEAEIKAIEEADEKARKKMIAGWKKLGATIRTGAKAFAAVTVAAGAGLLKLSSDFADNAQELDKWADKIGTTTQELQRIEFAGAQVGAETDNVREAVKTLRENLGELERVGTGPAVDSLATLGLRLEDIIDLPVEEQIGLLSERFQNLPNQAQRVSVALELMGEDGGALLPIFAEGADALAEYGDEAERLGVVLDKDAIEQGVAFKKDLVATKAEIKGLVATFAGEALPIVREWVGEIREWIGQNRDLIRQKLAEFIERAVEALRALASIARAVIAVGGEIVELFGGVETAIIATTVAFGAFRLAMLGLPGLVAGVSAAVGVTLGLLAADIAGLNDQITKLNARAAKNENIARRVGSANEASLTLGTASPAELARMSEEEFETLVNTALRGGKGDSAVAIADRRRAEGRKELESKRALQQFNADLQTGRGLEVARQRAGIFEAPTGRGGGRGRVDLSAAESAFGTEVRQLASRFGAGETAVTAALTAGAQSLRQGPVGDVARRAALSRLGGLVGQDLTARGQDPLLSQLLGTDVPDIELSSIARGAQPQTLISTINNSFTFDSAFQVNGAGEPEQVAQQIALQLRESFQGAIAASTKTAKVVFAR
jgi:hypothetical protein